VCGIKLYPNQPNSRRDSGKQCRYEGLYLHCLGAKRKQATRCGIHVLVLPMAALIISSARSARRLESELPRSLSSDLKKNRNWEKTNLRLELLA
jgi:hypothetical protein